MCICNAIILFTNITLKKTKKTNKTPKTKRYKQICRYFFKPCLKHSHWTDKICSIPAICLTCRI